MPTITPIKKLSQGRAQTTVTFTEEEKKSAEEKALAALGKNVKVEGFRPGKVPIEMLRQKIDPGSLSEETVRVLLPEVFDTVLKDGSLRPIIAPRVDLTSQSPLALTITFVEKPDVKVKGVDKITIPATPITVTPEQVDRMMDYLRQQYRTTYPVDRAAQEKDELTIDFVGTSDGKEVEGTRAAGYRLVIGGKTLIPGFEEQLIGTTPGSKKTFTLTFPADYHVKTLRGKPVEFSVTVHAVSEVFVPEFTDDVVRDHKLGDSVADLRSRIERSIKQQEETAERGRRERALFDAIRAATVIDLAPELLQNEERAIGDEIMRNLEREKLTFNDWLKQTDRTMEAFQKEMLDEARKRLTIRFAVQHVMDEKKIDVTEEELSKATSDALQGVPETERANAEAYYKGEGQQELRWRLRVEKLVEQMLA